MSDNHSAQVRRQGLGTRSDFKAEQPALGLLLFALLVGCGDRAGDVDTGPTGQQGVEPTVTFSKAEVRPGVPDNRHDFVTATIKPSGATVAFTSSNPIRAIVTPGSGQGTVVLTVDGISLSQSNQDTQLQAQVGVGGQTRTIASIPLTVVKPSNFRSTPKVVDNTPSVGSGDYTHIVQWKSPVTVTILDQFSVVLGTHWDGLSISESIDGGDPLVIGTLTGGSVIDPVVFTYNAGTQEQAQRILDGQLKVTAVFPAVQQEILADGAKLSGVNNRTKDLMKNVWTVTNSH